MTRRRAMQPGWLKEYFKPQDGGGGEHAVDDTKRR